jgi:hypothetical protein
MQTLQNAWMVAGLEGTVSQKGTLLINLAAPSPLKGPTVYW